MTRRSWWLGLAVYLVALFFWGSPVFLYLMGMAGGLFLSAFIDIIADIIAVVRERP